MSIAFRDRVYQRSLNDVVLYPAVSKSLIPDNFACQKGKGTYAARDRLEEFMHRHYRRYGFNGYVLKCDIKGYYPNMDHEVAKDCLARYVDGDALERAKTILDEYPAEVGFNPGSQILQIVGIALLDKMDHFIKEQLHVKYYLRYMDDFILILPDKESAMIAREEIVRELAKIKMTLNVSKTKIQSITEPIRFLGFDFRLTETGKVVITLIPDKVKHERRKLKKMIGLYNEGKRTREEIDQHYHDWRVHASYGNNTLMLRRMDDFYRNLWRTTK